MNTRRFELLALLALTACGGGGGGDSTGDAGPTGDATTDAVPSGPTLPCGNGVIDEGEACDNGLTEGDGCDRFCGVEICGDGVWHGREMCDDGNADRGDGCSPDCRIEPGRVCQNAPRLNTGADGAGAARPIGAADLVWSWSETAEGEWNLAALTDGCGADGGRTEAPEGARWIGRGGCDTDVPADTTTWYHAVFLVGDPAAALLTRISGRVWAADAIEDVVLNGESTGLSGAAGEAATGDGLDLSRLDAGRFVPGFNVLSIGVHNGAKGEGPNPDGLLVVVAAAYGGGSRCGSDGSCGNGTVDDGEVCDDFNVEAGDGCAADCSALEICGNGVLEPGEECDVGDVVGGDGCSLFCHTEACGDGILAWNEGCDDANIAAGDGCAADCTIEDGMECVNAHPLATGSNGRGGLRHTGYADLVWTWSESADGGTAPAVVSENCDPEVGGWASPTPEAQWVTQVGCHVDAAPETTTYYRASFSIPTAAAAAATRLAGRLWADSNITSITVNGAEAPLDHLVGADHTGGGYVLADIPPSLYREGLNTLVVAVHNVAEPWGPNPGGLLVTVPDAYGVGSFCAPPVPCGDGVLEEASGEVCDDGNREDGDGCSSDCRSYETCGNGIHDPGEACDDGNESVGDGCAPGCQSTEQCGDWVVDVEAGEVCDDGNYYSGDGCDATCTSTERCGNGIVDAFEECDEGDILGGDGCSPVCIFENRCGNGRTDEVEACDDGNQESGDGCKADCSSNERCGNGIVDEHMGETCDDANEEDGDGCSNLCQPEACGNGLLEGAEDCDDANVDDLDGCSADCEVEPGYRCVSAPNLNTGSDGQGGIRDAGQPDVQWTWSETLEGDRRPAMVSGNCAPLAWVAAGDGAEWINRAGCEIGTPGDAETYYHVTFTIPTIRQARNTVVDGRVWADNLISDVFVNGVGTGFRTEGDAGFVGPGIYFGEWDSGLYQRGENTLTVVVHNSIGGEFNPDGLLVHVPNAFGGGSRCAPAP